MKKDLKYLSLELIDYLRFKPNGVNRLYIDLTNIHQIIIGTNGSGKSSLLKEINLLPGNPKEFGPKGKKTITAVGDGTYYKLINDFAERHHYFLITDSDGETLEDLNPSGNISTQRKLVEEHFGLDAEIMAVLLGDREFKFTSMSKNRRKEWMLRLGNNNLDFAMDIHKKARNSVNQLSAVLKHLKKRVGEEETKRISDDEINELRRKSSIISDILSELMSAKIPNTPQMDQVKGYIRQELHKLNQMVDDINRKRNIEIDPNVLDIAHVTRDPVAIVAALLNRKENLQERIAENNQAIDKLYMESNRIKQIIETMAANAIKSMDDLNLERDMLIHKRTVLNSNIRIQVTTSNQELAFTTADQFKTDLDELLVHLEDNRDDYYNREEWSRKVDAIRKNEQLIEHYNKEIGQLEHQIKHMETNDKTECPSCGHKWFPMVNATLEQVRDRLKHVNELSSDAVENNAHWRHYCDRYTERRDLLVRINGLRIATQHAPFIEYLLSQEYWNKPSVWISQQCIYWHQDCSTNYELLKIANRLDVLEGAITAAQQVKADDITSDRIVQLDIEINRLMNYNSEAMNHIKMLELHSNEMLSMSTLYETGKSIVKRIIELIDNLVASGINQYIHSEIVEKQSELSNTQTALNAAESVLSILTMLEDDLAKTEADLKVMTILEEELSPTSGLIAEHISDFIRVFTQQMNLVIRQVWNQRLEVLPCGFDVESDQAGELDYRFPLMTGLEVATDVSKGSSAQRDMVDFAFVLVVYLYLGLDHHPLYIDELAPTMDDLHRVRITQFVKQLMEQNRHSQMFMISHYISGHGVFGNADYCVLSDTNILHKPNEFNKHVILE